MKIKVPAAYKPRGFLSFADVCLVSHEQLKDLPAVAHRLLTLLFFSPIYSA